MMINAFGISVCILNFFFLFKKYFFFTSDNATRCKSIIMSSNVNNDRKFGPIFMNVIPKMHLKQQGRFFFFWYKKNFKGELRPINWHAIYDVKEEMPVSSHESWRKTRFTIANSSSSSSLSYRRRHPPPQPHNHRHHRNPDGNADPSLTIANPKKKKKLHLPQKFI